MNIHHAIIAAITLGQGIVPLLAGPSTSASYSIPADIIDAGGLSRAADENSRGRQQCEPADSEANCVPA